jgi:hypothetical protein
VLAAEHLLGLAGVHFLCQLVEPPREIIRHGLPLLRPLDENVQILGAAAQRVAQRLILFEAAATLEQLLRGGLILPEIRVGDALFDPRQFVGGAGGVKDSSAGRTRGASGPRICGAVPRSEWSYQCRLAIDDWRLQCRLMIAD